MNKIVIAGIAGVLLGASGTLAILNRGFTANDSNEAVVRDIATTACDAGVPDRPG